MSSTVHDTALDARLSKEKFADLALKVLIEELSQQNWLSELNCKLNKKRFCFHCRVTEVESDLWINLETIYTKFVLEAANATEEAVESELVEHVKDVVRTASALIGSYYHSLAMPVQRQFKAVKDSLLPVFKPANWDDILYTQCMESGGRGVQGTLPEDTSLVRCLFTYPFPGVPDLGCTVAIDSPFSGQYVTLCMLKEWGQEASQLLRLARANVGRWLRSYGSWRLWRRVGPKGDSYQADFGVQGQGSPPACSALFFPEIIHDLQVDGDHVVLLPRHDVVYVTGSNMAADLAHLGDKVLEFKSDPWFLYAKGLRLREGAAGSLHWEVYQPEEGEGAVPQSSEVPADLFYSIRPLLADDRNLILQPKRFGDMLDLQRRHPKNRYHIFTNLNEIKRVGLVPNLITGPYLKFHNENYGPGSQAASRRGDTGPPDTPPENVSDYFKKMAVQPEGQGSPPASPGGSGGDQREGGGDGATSADQCLNCGEVNQNGDKRLLVCSKCEQAKYCSRTCQKAHWAQHKQNCLQG